MINNDNEIDREDVLDYLKTKFAEFDSGFGELHEKSLDHCIQRMKEHKGPDKMYTKCNHTPRRLIHCLEHQYLFNCPASAWTECERNFETCRGVLMCLFLFTIIDS